LAVAAHATALEPGVLDVTEQRFVLATPSALRRGQPGVVPARMHAHHPAKRSHRALHLLLADKGVPHVECLAKCAVAFFGVPRSSVTRRYSDFSRQISTAASCADAAAGPSASRCARNHWYRLHG